MDLIPFIATLPDSGQVLVGPTVRAVFAAVWRLATGA